MARRKKERKIIKNIEIQDIAAEGKAITRYNDIVIFVSNAVPGDVVDLVITKQKKNFWEAKPINFQKYSDLRTEPKCKHFGICGGCKWQNLPYETQLKFKHKQVVDQITRIGKVQPKEILPILGSQEIYYYRNKLEFTFSSRKWFVDKNEFEEKKTSKALGYHMPGMFDRVLDIEECHLQPPITSEILNKVRNFTIQNKYGYYDPRTHVGYLRNMVVRNNVDGEIMIIMIFAYEDKEKREKLLNFIKENFPQVVSIYYIINEKLNDSYSDLPVHHYHGKEFLIEKIENLKFRIGPKSFFQTNTKQAAQLYKKAKEYAQLQGNEVIYDLFTGTGTIALYFADKASQVVGIEIIAEAIEDAKENAKLNKINNVDFLTGDVKNVLNEKFFETYPKPDVIVLDPPRAGVHKDVIKTILSLSPQKIVYISCNPATQARDINMLSEKYSTELIQPVDMFPHTHHVENIALLKLK